MKTNQKEEGDRPRLCITQKGQLLFINQGCDIPKHAEEIPRYSFISIEQKDRKLEVSLEWMIEFFKSLTIEDPEDVMAWFLRIFETGLKNEQVPHSRLSDCMQVMNNVRDLFAGLNVEYK